jgi:hypothetical protein
MGNYKKMRRIISKRSVDIEIGNMEVNMREKRTLRLHQNLKRNYERT